MAARGHLAPLTTVEAPSKVLENAFCDIKIYQCVQFNALTSAARYRTRKSSKIKKNFGNFQKGQKKTFYILKKSKNNLEKFFEIRKEPRKACKIFIIFKRSFQNSGKCGKFFKISKKL